MKKLFTIVFLFALCLSMGAATTNVISSYHGVMATTNGTIATDPNLNIQSNLLAGPLSLKATTWDGPGIGLSTHTNSTLKFFNDVSAIFPSQTMKADNAFSQDFFNITDRNTNTWLLYINTASNLYFQTRNTFVYGNFWATNGMTNSFQGRVKIKNTIGKDYTFDTSTNGITTQRSIDLSPTPLTAFGALGDGITDNTSVFQSAFNIGTNYLFLPTGTYNITNTILITNSSLRLVGVGSDSIIRLINSASMNALSFSNLSNVAVRGIRLDAGGYGSGYAPEIANGLYFTNCSSVVVDSVTITNYASGGIYLRNCSNSKVQNCQLGPATPAMAQSVDVAFIGTSTNNLIFGNHCYPSSAFGISLYSDGVSDTVTGNIISHNWVNGKTRYGVLLYQTTASSLFSENTISENLITDIDGSYSGGSGMAYGMGIYIQGAEKTLVSGNSLQGIGRFTTNDILVVASIAAVNVGVVTITGNKLTDCYNRGISVQNFNLENDIGGHAIISNNTIERCGLSNAIPYLCGIHVFYHPNTLVVGNAISGVSEFGIRVMGSKTANISNNSVTNCPVGISSDQVDTFVLGNTVTGCATNYDATAWAPIEINPGQFIRICTVNQTNSPPPFLPGVPVNTTADVFLNLTADITGTEIGGTNVGMWKIVGQFKTDGAGNIFELGTNTVTASYQSLPDWVATVIAGGDQAYASVSAPTNTVKWTVKYDYLITRP